MKRRTFLTTATCALAASSRLGVAAPAPSESPVARRNPLCVFTKPLQSLSYDALADAIADLGFDGIEAPIRDGGHIEPARVSDELPKLVEALAQRDLEITVMASSIHTVDDPFAEDVLRTAAALGIKRYRMKYFKYNLGRPIEPQLDTWRKQLDELADLNRQLGIQAVYQNHAGPQTLGAALWDIATLLDKIDPQHIGIAYDIRHATVEGGMSWPSTFHRIQPHLDTVYVKDFQWTQSKRPENVPLGEGRIDPKFFKMLAQSDFAGPISLHEEYLDHRPAELVPQHLAAMKRDLETLRHWIDQASTRLDGSNLNSDWR